MNASQVVRFGQDVCRALRLPPRSSSYDCAKAFTSGHIKNVHKSKAEAQLHILRQTSPALKEGNTQLRVLEIGCGALDLASLLIPLLPPDSYVCIEPNAWLNTAVLKHRETLLVEVLQKRALFLRREDFDAAAALGADTRKFDIVFAHSVLSHAARPQLRVWLRGVARVLAPNGVAVASLYHHSIKTGRYWTVDSKHTKWTYPGITILSTATVTEEAAEVGFIHVTDLSDHLRQFYFARTDEQHDWAVFRWGAYSPYLPT